MKHFLRMTALLMALVFSVGALAACGEKQDDRQQNDASQNGGDASQNGDNNGGNNGGNQPAVKGTVAEHGYYTVLVPEEFTMKPGDSFGDETNPKAFTISKDNGTWNYYMFNMLSEENAKMSIAATQGANDAQEVTITYNGVEWTGVAYDADGTPCFSLYADFGDDHFVILTAAGNPYDGDVTEAVLSSLTVNVTE